MLDNVIALINDLSNGNQMIAGAISLWALGVMTYFAQTVPMKLYSFFLKHCTTELTLTSYNNSFHEFLHWFSANSQSGKVRKIKISNGRWGDNNKSIKSIGYGTHIIFFNKRPLLVTVVREKENHSNQEKETITITKLGRSHKLFDALLDKIAIKREETNTLEVYTDCQGDWYRLGKQEKRTFSSIVANDNIIGVLKDRLDEFKDKEEWYKTHGIPYQLGILLHGEAGTGKTSLIKGIASYLNYNMYSTSLDSSNLFTLINTTPNKSVVVLEDVDCSSTTHKRIEIPNKKGVDIAGALKDDSRDDFIPPEYKASLKDILNSLDGILTVHGRILIMTTNHVKKLDPALIRAGRIDLNIEISYLNEGSFVTFLNRFFETEECTCTLKDKKLTGAKLQGDILEGLTRKEIVNKYCEVKL